MALISNRSFDTISNYGDSRDNNFNLLRILAAVLVIFTHAFGITGNATGEPLKATFNLSFGSWAVDIFFVSSGFLISRSWDRSKSAPKFVWARMMRIYPALWLCVLICILVIGITFTTLPAREFLLHDDTLTFLVKNLTVLKGTFATLPGTFVGQGDGAINASLWTLHYELKMYLVLLALGWTGWFYKRGLVLTIVLTACSVHIWRIAFGLAETWWVEYPRFVFFFFLRQLFLS